MFVELRDLLQKAVRDRRDAAATRLDDKLRQGVPWDYRATDRLVHRHLLRNCRNVRSLAEPHGYILVDLHRIVV